MRCGQADRLMSRELDGALRPEQAHRLAAHLERCARCRAERAALRRTEVLLGTPPWSAPEPDLTAGVLARLPRDRRAVIPVAPAWTRASGIVVAALFVVLLGVGGGVLLAGAAVGYGAWPLVQESGRSVVSAGWDSVRELVSAAAAAAAALWRALRWPWAPIAGAAIVGVGVVWGWLWARSGRRRL